MGMVYNLDSLPKGRAVFSPSSAGTGYSYTSYIKPTISWQVIGVDAEARTAEVVFVPQFMYHSSIIPYENWKYGLAKYDSSIYDTGGPFFMKINQTYPEVATYESPVHEEVLQTWNMTIDYYNDYYVEDGITWVADTNYPEYSFNSFGATLSHLVNHIAWPGEDDELAFVQTLKYDDNGKMSFTLYWGGDATYESKSYEYGRFTVSSKSGKAVTTYIALPNMIDMNNDYLGNSAEITLKSGGSLTVASCKHTITYEFGSLTGTIITKTSNSSVFWTIPTSTFLPEYAENEVYKTVKLTCTTYDSSGVEVGYYDIERILFLDTGTGTIVNMNITDKNTLTAALTGDVNKLIRYYSDAQLELEVIAHTAVKSVQVNANNALMTVLTTSQMEDKITYPGGIPNVYRATVTVPKLSTGIIRGIANNKDGTIQTYNHDRELVPYVYLTINPHNFNFTTGGDITFDIIGMYFSQSFGAYENTSKMYYRAAAVSDGESIEDATWTEMPSTAFYSLHPIDGENYHNTKLTVYGFDIQKRYEIQFKLVDRLMEVVSVPARLVNKPVFDWNDDDFHFGVPVYYDEEIHMETDRSIMGGYGARFTPYNSEGNTVINYDGYDNENGETMIYGDKVNIFSHNVPTLNSYPIYGTWTPVCNAASSGTGYGNYIRLGNMVIVSFYYTAYLNKTTADGTYLYFTGLPFTPDSSAFHWQSGGGNCSGYTASQPFTCWNIEGGKIYGRTQSTSSSGYINGTSGKTLYASGTIMYRI